MWAAIRIAAGYVVRKYVSYVHLRDVAFTQPGEKRGEGAQGQRGTMLVRGERSDHRGDTAVMNVRLFLAIINEVRISLVKWDYSVWPPFVILLQAREQRTTVRQLNGERPFVKTDATYHRVPSFDARG